MAESGSREKATSQTSLENIWRMKKEGVEPHGAIDLTAKLRKELEAKGLKGFKRGGKVKKTGLAKLHKGERVLTAKQAKTHKPAARKSAARPRGRR